MRPSARDLASWARELDVSREALEIYVASDVIDLHIDTFIWHRVIGYDLRREHRGGPFGRFWLGHADLPRLCRANVTGAVWSITTNPARSAGERLSTFFDNLRELKELFDSVPERAMLVRTASEYRQARAHGRHAVMVGVQGGNAFDHDLSSLAKLENSELVRVTLVHLSSSSLGATSSPLRGKGDLGLSRAGIELVERLDAARIFVDLAHISPRGFWDAVHVHDRARPLLVSHTGVSGVYSHWRNIDDAQIRAVAETGGTIGVIYQAMFLGDPYWAGRAETIVRHIDHVVTTVGDDFVSLGSDWDGAIVTPRDMPTCLELPRLVQLMLDRGYSPERIQKILGGNYLRALTALRP